MAFRIGGTNRLAATASIHDRNAARAT